MPPRQFMTNRPQAAGLATEFLRDALAGGALGVPKLEVMARAAGLLGEDQCITHSKVFKKVKKSLGIQSVRDGFGAGRWLWQLPRLPPSTANLSGEPTGDPDPGGVCVEDDPGAAPAERLVPSEWTIGAASLDGDPDPGGVCVEDDPGAAPAERLVPSEWTIGAASLDGDPDPGGVCVEDDPGAAP